MQQKIKKQLMAFGGFVVVFGSMIWFGYRYFVKPTTKPVVVANGLNNKLPVADTQKVLNKLEQYMQAEKDSLMRKQQKENDPYSKTVSVQESRKQESRKVSHNESPKPVVNSNPQSKGKIVKRPRIEVNRPIYEIQYPPNSNSVVKKENENITPPLGGRGVDGRGVGVRGADAVDPSLQQLEGMLDKLIEIQHPEIVKERIKKGDKNADSVSKQNLVKSSNANQTIQAVVHNTQIIASGATIKLRLVQDILIGPILIPKGSFLYGICSISNERLTVQITNIPFNNQVIPVSVSVFDMDGIEGIYIPGAIERDVSKEEADQAIQSINLNSMNSSIAGQAASAGMQAGKALLSKKVKLVRVTVKAGHHVLLQNKIGY